MKTLFFIALIAIIAHATPTIRNERMESIQASDSLDGRAHRRDINACVDCGSGPIKPFCRQCTQRGPYGFCLNTQAATCADGGAVPDNVSCGTGYWGCIVNCCPGRCNK
ncbi:small secreted protein [Laccaria bicolor S238N-H82]|uniref:Small secreted protein n=1 Tax=Laccaria bicolor (strain S238N-H82 / ATCC MYA-4686) TaxID=486041 RepID=B0D2T6_LACBS|nr:small secreted protein [Laccaria bicolor S238N-H82]EDR10809.1 small secreted protein [Laccaria bicolor S238N-H82]|eukprot:XP_001878110.1 small secreted protein [Laccaria bicolor S238N-H82]